MSVSSRSMLMSGVAMATAGAVALSPALVAPPAVTLAQPEIPVPTVYIEDIQLAGIGRDLYNMVSSVVGGLVQWGGWAVGLIPFLGSGLSTQININYFELIKPLIGNTVYLVSDILADPLGLFNTLGSYVNNQVYTGYSWVVSQIRFFGLPPVLGPLPAPPPLASVGRSSARPAAARIAGPRAAAAVPATSAAVEAPAEVTADLTAELATPARFGRGELRRAARAAVAGARQTAQTAAAEAGPVTTEVSAAEGAAVEARSTARASRGAAVKAHTAAKAVANAAS